MLTFQKLWSNHPSIAGIENPCTTNGRVNFPDQCAIRVGVSLSKCGAKTANLPGVRHCWHHDKTHGHTLAAEELANGLAKFPLPGLGKLRKVEPGDFKNSLRGKKGIIFFKGTLQNSLPSRLTAGKLGPVQR